MSAMACPNCGGKLLIEHYKIPLVNTKAFGLSSRLVCKACPYKKEPKNLIDPRLTDIVMLAEKELEKERRRGGKKREKERTTIYISENTYSQEEG